MSLQWAQRLALAGLVAIFLVAVAVQSHAAAAGVAIGGAVTHTSTLSLDDLRKQPAVAVKVSFHTMHGQEEGVFTGALLWPLLQAAGPVDAPGKNTFLRHTITVTAQDGYSVTLSFGELSPDYGNEGAILAYEQDGKPIEGGVRLIVPADKHGGRAVHDVATLEIH